MDGAPSALSRLIPTPAASCLPGSGMDALRRSPSGTTSGPSTGGNGADTLTSSREASHARTSPSPERGPGSTESGPAYGESLPASFARWDRAASSWRTHQRSLDGDWEPYSATWPRWGSMHDGECWELTMPEPLTNGTESGLWPTPNVPNGGRSVAHVTDWRGRSAYHNGKKVQVGLEAAVKWQTPTAQDANGRDRHNQRDGSTRPSLLGQVTMYPTPTAGEHTQNQSAYPGAPVRPTLVGMARYNLWPTPRNNTGPSMDPKHLSLDGAVRFPSPAARDWRSGKGRTENGHTPQLPEVVGGQLNPDWVEWLMGWPIGWSDCAPLATDRFPQWLHSHGGSSTNPDLISSQCAPWPLL